MRLAQKLFRDFNSDIERFPQISDNHGDTLATLATLASAVELEMKRTIEVDYLPRPSIEAEQEMVQNIVIDIETYLGISWMDLIIHYFKDGSLPEDNSEAYRIKAQASRF